MNNKRVPQAYPPSDLISEELTARGWRQVDLAEIMGCTPYYINNIMTGRTSISTEIASALSKAFGTSAEFWLNLQSAYNLATMHESDNNNISRRALIYGKYPIREMKRRGWIKGSDDVNQLESELCKFLGKNTIDEACPVNYAARKTNGGNNITPEQEAWLARAWYLAPAVHIDTTYDDSMFALLLKELDLLKTALEEIRHIPRILAKFGIRFLIIEALPGTKIDGACFWLNESSPVIALSLRFDRIDGFWFNLTHELGHIKNRDGNIIDDEIYGENTIATDKLSRQEQRANNFASQFLLDQGRLRNFIHRHYPNISTISLMAFAVNNEVHPGIVVGQYHFCTKKYTHFRKFLISIKKYIIETALTDGYGNTISI